MCYIFLNIEKLVQVGTVYFVILLAAKHSVDV